MLAQPGQHFIEESLGRLGVLPGLREGIGNVSRDEQRHIAFGVKLLSDLVGEDPECKPAIEEILRETFPFRAAVFVPPGWDERYVTVFGFTLEQLYTHAAEAIEGRLRAAGLDPLGMRVGLPFDLEPAERTRRVLALLRAGYLGQPDGPVTANPEATALLFDGLRRSVNAALAPDAKIAWEFSDAEPWHLLLDHDEPVAAPGPVEHPDLILRCRFDDWLDVVAGRVDPWKALATGTIRPRGKIRMLVKAPKLFAWLPRSLTHFRVALAVSANPPGASVAPTP
jgi:hypothetical protein